MVFINNSFPRSKLVISGCTSVRYLAKKPAFWYTKLKLPGNNLYVNKNTFRPEDQKIDTRKLSYLINYSFKWLIALSREPLVL